MDLNLIENIHGKYIQERRVNVLAAEVAKLLPPGATVLDVGAGDGWLARLIQHERPDVKIEGVDVLVREKTHIPVVQFDGSHLPQADKSYDVVLFVDVLHHTEDPHVLLREANRVARRSIVIKDHNREGLLAFRTLKFMDQVGNKRYGVVLPFNYLHRDEWQKMFEELQLRPAVWKDRIGLYPFPLNLWFDRSLHFVCKLEPR